MPSPARHGGLQNRCSRARETTTFLKTDALVYAKRSDSNLGHFLAGPSKPSWGQPGANASRAAKKNASRAGKMLIHSARLENGGCGGPRNQCSRAREMTSFLKRYALVYVKRYYSNLGPRGGGPGDPSGRGQQCLRQPHAEPSPTWRPAEPVLPCTRNDNFPQNRRSRVRETIRFKSWPLLGGTLETELGPARH